MSYEYTPLPLFIAFCIILSVTLIIVAIHRRKIDRMGLIAFYITLAVAVIITAFLRVQEELDMLISLHDILEWIYAGTLALMFIELFYLSITHKGTRELKRRLYIGWGLIISSLLIGLVIFFVLD